MRRGTNSGESVWSPLAVCLLLATWIDLGSLQRSHHSDSLVPILVSTLHWTPYYWHQDRYGMLLPLLALPVSDPFANLLLQTGLHVFAALAAWLLLIRYLLPGGDWPLMGLLCASLFAAFAPERARFEMLGSMAYGVSFFLAALALALTRGTALRRANGPRIFGAAALLALAVWVNVAILLFLLPLALLAHAPDAVRRWRSSATARAFLRGARDHEASLLLLLFAAIGAASQALRSAAPGRSTSLYSVQIDKWPEGWTMLAVNSWRSLAGSPWIPVSAALAALGLLFAWRQRARPEVAAALRAAALLVASAVCYWLCAGTIKWVRGNHYPARYLIPSVFALQAAVAVAALAPLAPALAGQRRALARAAACVLALAAAAASYGWPSLASARSALDRSLGRLGADLVEARCTHVIGDYWNVWRAVFHANLLLHEQGRPEVVWGLAERSQATRRLWGPLIAAGARICAAVGDREVARSAGLLQIGPLHPIRRVGAIEILGADERAG